VVIAVAVGLAVWMVLRFRSFAYALVITWALFGIYSARMGQLNDIEFRVAEAALGGLAVVALVMVVVFVKALFSGKPRLISTD